MVKKLMSFILSITLLVSVSIVTGMMGKAEDTIILKQGNLGYNEDNIAFDGYIPEPCSNIRYVIWTDENGENGKVDITGSGRMHDFSRQDIITYDYVGGVYGNRKSPLSRLDNNYVREVAIHEGISNVGACLLYYCTKIKNVSMAEGIERIGYEAFYGCRNLSEISIPSSLTEIREAAFNLDKREYEKNQLTVHYGGTIQNWKSISIEQDNFDLLHAKIICSDGVIDKGLDHSFVIESSENATCSNYGKTTYHCNICGKYDYEYFPESDHNFSNNSEYCIYGCGTRNPNYVAPAASNTINPSAAIATSSAGFVDAGSNVQFDEAKSDAAAKALNVTVKATKLTAAKSPKKKTITIGWQKAKKISGYVVQVSTGKKFKKGTRTYIAKASSKNAKIAKKIKGKKKYYIRIRAFKTVTYNGEKVTVYGKWSKAKAVKTKG